MERPTIACSGAGYPARDQGPSIAASESMRAWGSRYARLILERCGRNKRAASRVLGISYHTLDAYLRYGYPSRTSGRRLPGWARSEGDPSVLVPYALASRGVRLLQPEAG